MRSAYGLDTPRADEWRDHANCHPAVAEKFWIHHGHHAANLSDDNRQALRLCRTCPVVAHYLEWLAAQEAHGG